jgi:hypothetical protein
MDVFVVFILRRDGHMHPKMNAALISCHFARRPPDKTRAPDPPADKMRLYLPCHIEVRAGGMLCGS